MYPWLNIVSSSIGCFVRLVLYFFFFLFIIIIIFFLLPLFSARTDGDDGDDRMGSGKFVRRRPAGRVYQLWANFGQGGPIDQLSPACVLDVYIKCCSAPRNDDNFFRLDYTIKLLLFFFIHFIFYFLSLSSRGRRTIILV